MRMKKEKEKETKKQRKKQGKKENIFLYKMGTFLTLRFWK